MYEIRKCRKSEKVGICKKQKIEKKKNNGKFEDVEN